MLMYRNATRLVLFTFLGGCAAIPSGHEGVEWTASQGTLPDPLAEGFHVVSPFSRVYNYDVREQEQHERLEVLANNGLAIELDTSIQYQPIAAQIYDLQKEVGPDYYDVVIEPALRSGARKVVGRYSPEEIYSTKREQIEREIYAEVSRKVANQHIRVNNILIADVHLPKIVEDAIEEKLRREQQALAMKFVLDKARQEAEQKKIQAEGIAAYQNILSKSLNPTVLRWQEIEAMQALAQSPNAKTIVLGEGGKDQPPLLLNMENSK